MDAVWKKLGVPPNKQFANIDKYGNTSAASIFIAMYEAYQQGKLHKDDILLLVAFGAGFTWGAAVFQWHLDPPDRGLFQKFTEIFHR